MASIRVMVVVIFVLLAVRLVFLQGATNPGDTAQSLEQVTVHEQVTPLRGTIYDRNGAVLAISVERTTIVADPYLVQRNSPGVRGTARALSGPLGVPVATLESELSESSGFVYLDKLADERTASRVQALLLPGITFEPAAERVDPAGDLASPLLGIVGASGTGLSGLEYQYDALLGGRSGQLSEQQAPDGVVLPDEPVLGSPGEEGTSLELTLDEQVQYEAEQALGSALVSSHALGGSAIVMDVHTGQILAMASLVVDPDGKVAEAPANYALTHVYEPGSVFKVVTFTAALDRRLITPSEHFTVPPYLSIGGYDYHDAEPHGTEVLSATDVLAQSSNLGTIEIAQRVGYRAEFDQIGRLGFGRTTGLDYPGESAGIVEPLQRWGPTDLASTAIGQNTAVTVQQVADMMNTVADGGVFVPPSLVRATVAPDGTVHPFGVAPPRRELPTFVTEEMRGMLEQVVKSGTAPAAAVPGYTVAGKTGTAQIPNPNGPGYLPGQYMATFAGFAPAENPALSAVVVLDRPTPIFGGTVAAPVFSQIMRYALHRYGIPTSPGASSGSAQPAPLVPLSQLSAQGSTTSTTTGGGATVPSTTTTPTPVTEPARRNGTGTIGAAPGITTTSP